MSDRPLESNGVEFNETLNKKSFLTKLTKMDYYCNNFTKNSGKCKTLLTENNICMKLWKSYIVNSLNFRHGGCYGEGDIRKLAYFESSVDPLIAAGKVCQMFF